MFGLACVAISALSGGASVTRVCRTFSEHLAEIQQALHVVNELSAQTEIGIHARLAIETTDAAFDQLERLCYRGPRSARLSSDDERP